MKPDELYNLITDTEYRQVYKLITGFYPSLETAKRIAKKIKGNCKTVKVEPYEEGFTVVLFSSNDYEEIDNQFSKYMQMKIYCGILPLKE